MASSGFNMTAILPNSTNQTFTDEDPKLAYFRYITGFYISGCLCLIGLVGNFLILLVLYKDRKKTSNTVFLQALAVFDSGLLIAEILVHLLVFHGYTGYLPWVESPWYLFLIITPGWTAQTCCIWTVMLMTIDRYLIVSYPLKSAAWCTPKNARISVIVLTVTSVLFNAPRWPYYYLVIFQKTESSSEVYVSHQEATIAGFDEDLYRQVYHISLSMVFLFILPLLIIITLNIRLIYHVRQAIKQRQAMTQNPSKTSNQSLNITIMMVIVITVFVICQMPDFIASLIGSGAFKVDKITYGYYAGYKEILLIFNSAVNFFLYMIFFRRCVTKYYVLFIF